MKVFLRNLPVEAAATRRARGDSCTVSMCSPAESPEQRLVAWQLPDRRVSDEVKTRKVAHLRCGSPCSHDGTFHVFATDDTDDKATL